MDPKKFVFARAVPSEDPDEFVFARAVGAPAGSMDVVAERPQPIQQVFSLLDFDRQNYLALSHPQDSLASNEPNPNLYRKWGEPETGSWTWNTTEGRSFDIAYTAMGDRGVPVLFLHGVPTNRRQWYPVQRLCAPFCRTLSIDMLGMGKSSKPTDYATARDDFERWKWRFVACFPTALTHHHHQGMTFPTSTR